MCRAICDRVIDGKSWFRVLWSKKTQTINEEDLQNHSKVSAHVRRVADCFGVKIDHFFIETLKLSLDAYTKFLLQYINKSGEYTFTHRVIGEIVGVVLGEHRPRECIQLCQRDFLMERITMTNTDEGNLVRIPPNLESVLIQKFVQMIRRDGCNFTEQWKNDGLDADILKHEVFGRECFAKAFILHVINTNLEGKLFQVPLHPLDYYKGKPPVYLLEFTLSNALFTLAQQIVCHITQLLRDTKYVSVESIYVVMLNCPELFETLVEFGGAKVNDVLYIENNLVRTTMLIEAIRNNLNDAVSVLLKYGAEPCMSVLHYATEQQNEGIVAELLKYGASCNARDWNGRTPLYNSVEKGGHDVVRLLLQHGANVNVTDLNGNTPLHQAARGGYCTIVEFLLQHGAYYNVTDGKGNTPLHQAAQGGHYTIVEMLLQHRADVNVKNNIGNTPLNEAAWLVINANAKVLLQHGADANVKNSIGNTPLNEAARNDYHETVEVLLQHGADVNVKNRIGNTPLIEATGIGRHATVEVLLQQGADFNVKDFLGNTHFHVAAQEIRRAIVEAPLQHGADVDVKGVYGNTPLHEAARSGYSTTVKVLLQHGADVNARDLCGYTPLHEAAREGHHATVEVLLQHGAAVNV